MTAPLPLKDRLRVASAYGAPTILALSPREVRQLYWASTLGEKPKAELQARRMEWRIRRDAEKLRELEARFASLNIEAEAKAAEVEAAVRRQALAVFLIGLCVAASVGLAMGWFASRAVVLAEML